MTKLNAHLSAMALRARAERGMSLVEATIILLVIATLTAVISPSMGDYLEDARQAKAKEDVEALGISIVRMLRDTGLKGLKLNAAVGFTEVNRVDLLLSAEGSTPTNAGASFTHGSINGGNVNWDDLENDDTFENQLEKNFPGGDTDGSASYSLPAASNRGRGWRGSYFNTAPGADPWGYTYLANPVFLTTTTDDVGATEGLASGFWARDVIVLSAGPDNTIQSNIGGSGQGGSGMTTANDDISFVVQGNTR